MKRTPKITGVIVSQISQSDESVCIACGQPIEYDHIGHIGFQTAQSLMAPYFCERVRRGITSPHWRRDSLLAAKRWIKSGVTCSDFTSVWIGIANT